MPEQVVGGTALTHHDVFYVQTRWMVAVGIRISGTNQGVWWFIGGGERGMFNSVAGRRAVPRSRWPTLSNAER